MDVLCFFLFFLDFSTILNVLFFFFVDTGRHALPNSMLLNNKRIKRHLGYLWTRFEYFQVRFAPVSIPSQRLPILGRAKRALSTSLITFFPSLPWPSKCKILLKKHLKSCKSRKTLVRFAPVSIPNQPF